MTLYQEVLAIFVVTNPIGNLPVLIALLKDFDLPKQRQILLREGILAYLIGLCFLFVGETFLDFINVSRYSISICGGSLLFIVALQMIFPHHQTDVEALKREPVIVPIATPLLAGGCMMTTILVLGQQDPNTARVFGAITLSSVIVIGVLMVAPYIHRLLGCRGIIALEQLMGMVLAMLGIEMIVSGIHLFLNTV